MAILVLEFCASVVDVSVCRSVLELFEFFIRCHSRTAQSAGDLAERIYRRGNLHVLEIPQDSSDQFAISDNPIVLLDFERQDLLRFVPWWEIGQKDIWLFMSISPKKGIFYTEGKRKDGPIENENESLVQLFNFGQYLCCSDEVFSQSLAMLLTDTCGCFPEN